MQFFTDSFSYHCTLHQSDRPFPYLLMLHGFMGSSKVFDHLIEDLKSFCNPITIDLAGHGRTESPGDSEFYTAERQVSQLHSILRRLHFDNLYLYGYSMGGRLAFQLIASHASLFSGAIIESSHCGIQSDMEKTKREKADEKRAREIENNFDGFIDHWMNLPLFKHTPPNMKSVYEELMREQDPMGISASLRGFGAGTMPSVCDQINKIPFPITLIAGELDQKYADKMKSIEDESNSAQLHFVKNAGHRVHADQPDQLIEILRNAIS